MSIQQYRKIACNYLHRLKIHIRPTFTFRFSGLSSLLLTEIRHTTVRSVCIPGFGDDNNRFWLDQSPIRIENISVYTPSGSFSMWIRIVPSMIYDVGMQIGDLEGALHL